MIIKKYTVKTIEEVQEQINRDFGPNAVILTSKQTRYKGIKSLFFSNKFEVVAAVDEEDLRQFEQMKRENGKSDQETSQALASEKDSAKHEWESSMLTLAENETQEFPAKFKGLEESDDFELSSIPGTYLDPRFNRKKSTVHADEPPKKKEERFDETLGTMMFDIQGEDRISKRINEVQGMSESLIDQFGYLVEIDKALSDENANFRGYSTSDEGLQEIIEEGISATKLKKSIPPKDIFNHKSISAYLISIGILPLIAEKIENTLSDRFNSLDMTFESVERTECLLVLKKELAGYIKVAGPICLVKGKPTYAAFLGTPGSGRTTMCLRIARQYIDELGKKTAIISMATPDKRDHVNSLTEEFGIPVKFACDKIDLQIALDSFKDFDLVLIDSLGSSVHEAEKIYQVSELLESIPHAQNHLVLNGANKDLDLLTEIEQFSFMEIDSLIFTKLDETIAKGSLINISQLTEYPISYVSYGPNISRDFFIAEPMQVAQTIIEKKSFLNSTFAKALLRAMAL